MATKTPSEAENQSSACERKVEACDTLQQRRSANYKPNIWQYDSLNSLASIYDGPEFTRRTQKLIDVVRNVFAEADGLVAKLKLIDNVKKLGLAIHFEKEIKESLDSIQEKTLSQNEDLYATALCFRLLRQHGCDVSQDMFRGFVDEKTGTFKESTHANIKGMLELLEVSYLALEGEKLLDEAKQLSAAILKEAIPNLDANLSNQAVHALELPSQRRVQWFDVKWHASLSEKDNEMNAILLEFAKLNFNTIQAEHQKELKELSRWWKNLGLRENMSFARDRLVEAFMCTVGFAFEPRNKCFRQSVTKVLNLVLVIDDLYDVYGTLEELKDFTKAVERWDVKETQHLPESMKSCFLALYNTTDEIASEIQKGKRWSHSLPHLKKVWTDFCSSLLVEAKWQNTGYTPSLQEYIRNAWISSSVSVVLTHAFFCIEHEVEDEFEKFVQKRGDLMYNISLIVRLCNDLATSKAEIERGDAASSILCYMKEENVSEEMASEYIKGMINKTWKKLNGQCFTRIPKAQSFVNTVTNIVRMGHVLYRNGDGFGVQDRETKNSVISVLVEPLLLN